MAYSSETEFYQYTVLLYVQLIEGFAYNCQQQYVMSFHETIIYGVAEGLLATRPAPPS